MLEMALSLKWGLCQSRKMRHGLWLYPACVCVCLKPACPQCSHSVCVCYYAETDHIRRRLLSTDEKVMVTTGKGAGFLDEPFKSPQSCDSHHLVHVSCLSVEACLTEWSGNFSKNPTLLIHWLNPHCESTADTAATCNSPSHFNCLNFLSHALKTCQQSEQCFSVFLLLTSATHWKLFLLTGISEFKPFSLLVSLVCVSRRMMNLLCHSCHS